VGRAPAEDAAEVDREAEVQGEQAALVYRAAEAEAALAELLAAVGECLEVAEEGSGVED